MNYVNWTAEHMKNTSVHCQCEDGWHLHVDKCYFFSEVDKSWDSANNICASLNSTLAACVNPAERGFVLSQNWSLYLWIGPIEGRDGELRWPNGSTFNNRTCCYLNHNGFTYGSCHLKRQSICTKPAHCGEETE
ncbi:early activation antigen CD69-like [Pleurodeles waltl]|uniref:early activation antigen CD69-like n=1 Tax=Pleurodeles waltl TaxID=8319 RepID=UPI00370959D4